MYGIGETKKISYIEKPVTTPAFFIVHILLNILSR